MNLKFWERWFIISRPKKKPEIKEGQRWRYDKDGITKIPIGDEVMGCPFMGSSLERPRIMPMINL